MADNQGNATMNAWLGSGDLLDRILAVPLWNLESRVKELEKEVTARLELSDKLHRRLQQERMRLQSKLPIDVQYSSIVDPRKTAIERGLLDVEINRIQEYISCFRDLLKIKHDLREAREKLRKERMRFSLLSE
jgi:hypothetical protein